MNDRKPLVPGSKINDLTGQLDVSPVLCGTKTYSAEFMGKGKLCPEASGNSISVRPAFWQLSKLFNMSSLTSSPAPGR